MKSVIFCSARAVDTVFLASVDAFKHATAAIFRAKVGDPMAILWRTECGRLGLSTLRRKVLFW
jgi:hypothetical protein